MISYFAISGLVNFLVSIFLGSLVLLKGRKEIINKICALAIFSVAFWSFGYFKWQISTNASSALFWSRVLMAGAIFIPIFYLHLVTLLVEVYRKKKRLIQFLYFLGFLFLLLDFTPYFVKKVEPTLFFPFWPKAGIFYLPFLLMFFLSAIYGWYLLFIALKQAKDKIKKQQIKYFLTGTAIGFISGSTNYFLWYDIPIPPYPNIFVSIYALLVGLAIVKYHLFEIRVILTEILVGVMGVILFLQMILRQPKNGRFLLSQFSFYF
jgi:hypothetical protein